MSFTYAEMKTAIQDYTENTETTFVNNINVFIKNAEERILKIAQLEVFRKNKTGNLTAYATDANNAQYLALPSDYLAPFSLSYTANNSKEFVMFKDVNFVQSFNPDKSTTGGPRYYAQFDINNFILAPSPDQAYPVELHYFYRPASLTTVGDNNTTWLSTNASVALLYGTLIEAYTFMKGEADLVANYTQRFTEAMSRVKNFGESQEVTDAYRTGLIMREKT
jgi:ribosomal protein S20